MNNAIAIPLAPVGPLSGLRGMAVPRSRPPALAAMVVVHLLLLGALANLGRVGEVVHETAPLFVSFISDRTAQPLSAAALPALPAPARPPVAVIDLPPPPVVAAVITAEAARPATSTAETPRNSPAPEAAPVSAAVPAAAAAFAPAPVVAAVPPAQATASPPAAPRQIPSAGVQFTEPPLVEYPKASRRNGEAGTVVVRAHVGTEGGAPRSVQIEQSCGFVRLDQAALAAVQRARFRPYTDNGRPVEGWALIPIRFELEK